MPGRVAYLTMADCGDFVTDYELSYAPMAAPGFETRPVSWRNPDVDWNEFDAVYICTPWDYPQYVDEFLAVLERIDRSRAKLVNDLSLVRWNLDKRYLLDLEARGTGVVLSLWRDAFDAEEVPSWFRMLESDTFVIKPAVGANAEDTYVLEGDVDAAMANKLASVFTARPFFVQPFIRSIRTTGEYSLFLFGGEYSHAIRKVPDPSDFRCQEEHGAEILAHSASPELVSAAAEIVAGIRPRPAYARVDFVLADESWPLLMELELIEPSLYLRMDSRAATRFARGFDTQLRA